MINSFQETLSASLDRLLNGTQNPEYIEHEDIYGRVNVADFNPCNISRLNIRTEKENLPVLDISSRLQNGCDTNESKLADFLKSAEEYLISNGYAEIIPRGLNDEQKLIMMFYRLFDKREIPIIESLYLTARDVGFDIPEYVYEMLKVCRLSYQSSILLFQDIGSYTVFHPYFYENILQKSLDVLCKREGDTETFENFNAVFMSARYHKIQLCGRLIHKMLAVISFYRQFNLLGIILEYAINQDISICVLTDAFIYFKEFPEIFHQIYEFFISHTEVTFVKDNFPVIINRYLAVCAYCNFNDILIVVLEYMMENKIFISVEALDRIFSSSAPQSIENLMQNLVDMIDLTEYVLFEAGSFSQCLWEYFKQLVESEQIEVALSLLPYLTRIDVSLPEPDFLVNFYRLVCDKNLDDSIMCRVRGFIQHFNCF